MKTEDASADKQAPPLAPFVASPRFVIFVSFVAE
jgi:hypothetical protein